jgi:hypothetical protein
MDQIAKNLPEIIKASASSPLGILALMIIALAILAFYFFKAASEKARIMIFVILFVGVAALAGVIMRQSKIVAQRVESNNPSSPVIPASDSGTIVPKPKTPLTVSVPTEAVIAGHGIYKILSAKIDTISDENLSLSFNIRYARDDSWFGGTFMAENFRLIVDEVPMAPTKAPIETVEKSSTKEGVVAFTIPATTKNAVLQVGQPGYGFSKIHISLKAAE